MSTYNYCPACGNLLLIDTGPVPVRLRCRSCSFAMDLQRTQRRDSTLLTPLDVNAFIVSDNAMNFSNKTEIKCEKCGHHEASYTEVQIRSADEPATVFYCCCACKHRWRDG